MNQSGGRGLFLVPWISGCRGSSRKKRRGTASLPLQQKASSSSSSFYFSSSSSSSSFISPFSSSPLGSWHHPVGLQPLWLAHLVISQKNIKQRLWTQQILPSVLDRRNIWGLNIGNIGRAKCKDGWKVQRTNTLWTKCNWAEIWLLRKCDRDCQTVGEFGWLFAKVNTWPGSKNCSSDPQKSSIYKQIFRNKWSVVLNSEQEFHSDLQKNFIFQMFGGESPGYRRGAREDMEEHLVSPTDR